MATAEVQPVLVPIDPDLADWFRSQGDIIREINNLCRFYMDTSVSKELDFEFDTFENRDVSPSSGHSSP